LQFCRPAMKRRFARYAGLVIASNSTVPCSPSGFKLGESLAPAYDLPSVVGDLSRIGGGPYQPLHAIDCLNNLEAFLLWVRLHEWYAKADVGLTGFIPASMSMAYFRLYSLQCVEYSTHIYSGLTSGITANAQFLCQSAMENSPQLLQLTDGTLGSRTRQENFCIHVPRARSVIRPEDNETSGSRDPGLLQLMFAGSSAWLVSQTISQPRGRRRSSPLNLRRCR